MVVVVVLILLCCSSQFCHPDFATIVCQYNRKRGCSNCGNVVLLLLTAVVVVVVVVVVVAVGQ